MNKTVIFLISLTLVALTASCSKDNKPIESKKSMAKALTKNMRSRILT